MHSYMHTFIPIPPISTGMRSPATARRPSQSLMIRSQQPLPQSPMYSPHQYQHQPASGGARTPNSRYNTPSKGLFVHLFTSLMIMVIIMTMMGTDDVHMRTCVCVCMYVISYLILWSVETFFYDQLDSNHSTLSWTPSWSTHSCSHSSLPSHPAGLPKASYLQQRRTPGGGPPNKRSSHPWREHSICLHQCWYRHWKSYEYEYEYGCLALSGVIYTR